MNETSRIGTCNEAERSGTLSVVIPAFNEELSIPVACSAISKILTDAEIEHELLLIDDGSTDCTWDVIVNECSSPLPPSPIGSMVGIKFSRNFGKESAIFAGLEKASGACVAVIDCDLQHPPEKLVEMYALWQKGFDVVEGVKETRGNEGTVHKMAASAFYSLITRLAGFDMKGSSDFKLLDRKVVDTMNAMPERGVFFRALSHWTGYSKAEVTYRVQDRAAGESKWSVAMLVKYACKNIASFSTAPLQIVTLFGAMALLVSLIFGGISLAQWIAGDAVSGFTTVILLLLFMCSLIMVSLGVIGFYIARMYDELKGRPRFVIDVQI